MNFGKFKIWFFNLKFVQSNSLFWIQLKKLGNLIIISLKVSIFMDIQKCECPPGGASYVDEDGMIICNSCGGWKEGQY